ncbi:MAG: hypothetical protein ABIO85_08195 [Sphingomicrobium sp.]
MDTTQRAYRGAFPIWSEIKKSVSAGDIVGAHSKWVEVLAELGKDYRNLPPNDAGRSMIEYLLTVMALIPETDDAKPARSMVAALLAFISEAPTGKRTHKLFNWNGLQGTFGKTDIYDQVVIAKSIACWSLLSQFKHNKPAKFITDTLNSLGYQVGTSTVRQWKRRIKLWETSRNIYIQDWYDLLDLIDEHQIKTVADAESVVRKELHLAVTYRP